MEKTNISERKNRLTLHNVNGFPLTAKCLVQNFKQALTFKPSADDIIISGYPKSGTTWTQYILWEIVNHSDTLPNVNEMRWREVPQLEMAGTEGIETMKPPRLFKVNLSFHLTPYHPSAKYIYVFRNPWDCCISAYNYYKQVDEGFSEGTFEEYFQYFMKGEVTHGDYFDHLLSWLDHWNDPNILFVSFEGMKRNTREAVIKIAKFLGGEYYKRLRENEECLQSILSRIQFDHMKQNCAFYVSSDSNKKINFFHSGSVGQWKKYFTEEQYTILKNKFLDKLMGTEIFHTWKECDLLAFDDDVIRN